MKPERKLKRGLAELSPLFLKQAVPPLLRKKKVTILPPESVRDTPAIQKSIVFSSFVPVQCDFDFGRQLDFLDHQLNSVFEKKLFVSVGTSPGWYESVAAYIALPAWKEMLREDCIKIHEISPKTVFAFVPASKISNCSKIVLSAHHEPRSSAFVLFDSESIFHAFPRVKILNLLDHVVFVLPPSGEALIEAYQKFQMCLAENRHLRFSILVNGDHAEDLCEFIFDEFSNIVSQFKGCDFSLLGWMEQGRCELNSVIFQETEEDISSKLYLSQELQLIS